MRSQQLVSHMGMQYLVDTTDLDEATSFTIATRVDGQHETLPANGGTRWRSYGSRSEQEAEAVMLAHRMALKHGLYDTGFSGGKIVVNSSISPHEATQTWKAIGEMLNAYAGRMYTGCDLGTSSEHMRLLRTHTPWILDALEAPQINTSVSTGYGVWTAIRKIVEAQASLQDRTPTIAIHGLGKVGCEVAHQCLMHGLSVLGCDIDPRVTVPTGVRRVDVTDFWNVESDVLCTASISALLDEEIVGRLKTSWIVSAANSPFKDTQSEDLAHRRGISCLPDYTTNAGAVICDSVEIAFSQNYSKMSQFQINEYVGAIIGAKTEEILRRADILKCDIKAIIGASATNARASALADRRALA